MSESGTVFDAGKSTKSLTPRSLVWKIILPVPLAVIAGVVGLAIWLPGAIEKNTVETAIKSATATVNQFKTVRGYYTKNVVKKAVQSGALKPSFNHATEENSIPLPATFIHDLSALLS